MDMDETEKNDSSLNISEKNQVEGPANLNQASANNIQTGLNQTSFNQAGLNQPVSNQASANNAQAGLNQPTLNQAGANNAQAGFNGGRMPNSQASFPGQANLNYGYTNINQNSQYSRYGQANTSPQNRIPRQTASNMSNGMNGQYTYNQGSDYKTKKDKKKGSSIFKKFILLLASAAVFGLVSGGIIYGINRSTILSFSSSYNGSDISLPQVSSGVSQSSKLVTEGDTSTSTEEMNTQAVANAALPAMVALTGKTTVTQSSGMFFGSQSVEASTSGTGIIVGKNDTELLILTNAHVVSNVSELKAVFIDNEQVSAIIKGSKADKDVAVVAVNLSDIKSSTLSQIAIAEFGDSDDVALGQEVVAIGNALGEGQSVTNGIISAKNRSITVDNTTFDGLLMTNAAINSGNSGGALLNAAGKVIGINFAKTSETGVEGMAYSIPIAGVRDLIDSLMNRETRTKVSDSEASYLGINGIDITSSMSSYYGYPQGLQIRTVSSGSAAEKAGLGKYDIIVGFDDQTITSMSSLQEVMKYYKAGEKVKIEYYHLDGNQYVLKTVDVTLGSKN